MSKRGIYITTKKALMGHDEKEEKIFNFLLKSTHGATQVQISKMVGFSRQTVKRKLDSMMDNPFKYGEIYYFIICENGKYKTLRKQKTTIGLENTATYAQKMEFNDRFENEVENLSAPNILSSTTAEKISENIIHYNINIKYNSEVKSSIKKLYNDDIYDIAVGEKGVYIVLKEDTKSKINEKIVESLEKLYTESLKKRKLNYPDKNSD